MPLYSTLLITVCVGTALTSYTNSTANRLTSRATTTKRLPVYFNRNREERNWTYNLDDGQFHCERAVSNCDIILLVNDIYILLNNKQGHSGAGSFVRCQEV